MKVCPGPASTCRCDADMRLAQQLPPVAPPHHETGCALTESVSKDEIKRECRLLPGFPARLGIFTNEPLDESP